MANETLITQLDELREAYSQQQKAAAALQTTLKTMTAAQSKTQKALTDYGARNTGVDVYPAQEMLASLRLKEEMIDPLLPDLRRELKALASLTGALKEAAAALRSEPADVVRLDKAIAALQGAQQDDIAALLPEMTGELELAQMQLGSEFAQKLRDALADHGISIGGRAPHFEIGRFEMEVNFARRFFTLRYGKDMVIPRAPITVEAALKAYDSASTTVMGRQQNGQAWINQLYEAYEMAWRKRGVSGTRVNIVDCYVEMVLLRQGRAFSSEPSKRTFSDYSRAQFIYDFYEFAHHHRLTHNGSFVRAHSATKSQADSVARSMWIVEGDSPYDGRYIADIEFEKG
jgi:hypothetical protein